MARRSPSRTIHGWLLLWLLGLAPGSTAEGQQPAPPRARPVIPVAASTLIASADPYVGEPVSLAAVVDAHVSRTAFTVDHERGKSSGKDVLVIAPGLQRAPAIDAPVTVIGEVARFDPAAVAAKLDGKAVDLPADAAARYAGKTVVIATSVVDSAGTDLARRLPPPMTPDEVALQKLMKQAGSARGALQKAIEASDAKAAAEQGTLLKQTFAEVEAFWRSRRQADATRFAADARRSAESLERAAAAARWDDLKDQTRGLSGACTACHDAHRERFDDGSFRIRKLLAR